MGLRVVMWRQKTSFCDLHLQVLLYNQVEFRKTGRVSFVVLSYVSLNNRYSFAYIFLIAVAANRIN